MDCDDSIELDKKCLSPQLESTHYTKGVSVQDLDALNALCALMPSRNTGRIVLE